jgi:hypothetical protein
MRIFGVLVLPWPAFSYGSSFEIGTVQIDINIGIVIFIIGINHISALVYPTVIPLVRTGFDFFGIGINIFLLVG